MTSSLERSVFLSPGKCLFAVCEAVLLVKGRHFHVCKEQLSHASPYFRDLFETTQKNSERNNEYFLTQQEKPEDVLLFLETTFPHPHVRPINERTLSTLIRLSDKFQVPSLKSRCAEFVGCHADAVEATKALEWLICCVNYKLPEKAAKELLPTVAVLSLKILDCHREAIGQYYGDLVAAKLRLAYKKKSDFQVFGNAVFCSLCREISTERKVYCSGCNMFLKYNCEKCTAPYHLAEDESQRLADCNCCKAEYKKLMVSDYAKYQYLLQLDTRLKSAEF